MNFRYVGAICSFLALCACLLLQYTGNFSAPESPHWGALIWGTLLAMGLLGARWSDETASHAAVPGQWFARLGLIMATGTLVVFWLMEDEVKYQRLAVLPDNALASGIVWGLLAVLGASFFLVGRWPWVVAVALGLGTFCVRGIGLEVWGIHPATRDMLALITSAQDAALSGENPYDVYQMQHTSEVPLTYLPGMWLATLPLRALGVDIRWMHVLADSIVPLALWWGTRGRARAEAQGHLYPESGVAIGLGALWMVLPSIQWNTIYAEPSLWWGLLACLLASRARGKTWLTAVLLGIALCTRHFAVILLPFFLLDWWVRLGFRRAVALTSVSGVICAVLLTPFVAADAEIFWFGTLKWLREYGPVHKTWFYGKFGFAKALYTSGWMRFGVVLQVAGVLLGLGASALCARREAWRRRGIAMWPALFAYTIFVMCNGLIWFSFFVGLVLCAALLRIAPIDDEPRELSSTSLRLSAIALALSLCCGAYIVYTLAVQSMHPGLDATKDALASHGVESSRLVDDHARRLEFIEPEPLLGTSAPTVWRHLQTLRVGEEKTLWRVRDTTRGFDPQIDLWSNPSVLAEQPAAVARLATTQSMRHGVYLTEQFTLPSYRGRFSAMADGFDAAYVSGEGRVELVRQDEKTALWQATPTLPGWARVERQRCKISGASGEMLFAHPRDGQVLELTWREIEAGEMIVFFGGFEQGAIRYDKAAVALDVSVSHSTKGRQDAVVDLVNRPGLRGVAVDTSAFSGERVTVTMRLTTPDASQRWTCVDALLF